MQCKHELQTGTCSWCNGTPDSWSGNTAWDAGFPVESRVTVTTVEERLTRTTERAPLYERLPTFVPAVVTAGLVREPFVPTPRYIPRWVEHAGASTTFYPTESLDSVRRRDLPEYSDMWTDERRKAWGVAVKAGMLWDSFVGSTSDVAPDNDPWHPLPQVEDTDHARPLRSGLNGIRAWRAASGRRGGFAPPRSTLTLIASGPAESASACGSTPQSER